MFLLQFLPCDGIGGEPVVQEKEHRGTFGRCSEQIAELPHGIRTDRVAFILGDEPAVGALRGINIEVVVPKIHHYFLELALAVNGARHFGHGKLGDNALGRANLFIVEHLVAEAPLALALPFRFHGVRIRIHVIGVEAWHAVRVGHLDVTLLFGRDVTRHRLHGGPHLFLLLLPVFLDGYAFAARGDLRLGEFVHEFCGGHFQRWEPFEARI